MTPDRFGKWFARAYPHVRVYKPDRLSSLVYLSDNNREIQCIIKDGTFVFPDLISGYIPTDDDYHFVLYCMILWGTPKLEYQFPVNSKEPVRVPKISKKSQKIEPKTSGALQKIVSGTKGDILKELESYSHHSFKIVEIPGGSIEAIVDGNHGPVLYDYGLTPGVTKGYMFVPYSHQSEVRKILKNFKDSLR